MLDKQLVGVCCELYSKHCIGLKSEQKDMLRDGLKNECFSKTAKEVALELRKKGKHDEALALTDMSPLFDPHNFWHNQPVP